MGHVMVPVPEEFTREVQRFLMETDMRSTASRRGQAVDAELVRSFLSVINDRCRPALSVLAETALTGRNITISELAMTMGWSQYETVGVVQELNELVWKAFGPMIGSVRTAPIDHQSGSIDWNERQVVLWADLATAVVAAEAELAEGA